MLNDTEPLVCIIWDRITHISESTFRSEVLTEPQNVLKQQTSAADPNAGALDLRGEDAAGSFPSSAQPARAGEES